MNPVHYRKTYEHTCSECRTEFEGYKNAKTCSSACRSARSRRLRKARAKRNK